MNTGINPGDSHIDSRDVISRIAELESEIEDCDSSISNLDEVIVEMNEILEAAEEVGDVDIAQTKWDEKIQDRDDENNERKELQDELNLLQSLADECEGYGDWDNGEDLILDSDFEEYAQDLAEDCYDMSNASSWPFCHIDWEAAADALKMDYMEVTFGDSSYQMRA